MILDIIGANRCYKILN